MQELKPSRPQPVIGVRGNAGNGACKSPPDFTSDLDEHGRKAPYYIHLADQDVFAFAGLWDRSFKADGTAVESVVHITMPANELMKSIHNAGNNPFRLPAILRKEDHEAWLTGSVDDARAVLNQ